MLHRAISDYYRLFVQFNLHRPWRLLILSIWLVDNARCLLKRIIKDRLAIRSKLENMRAPNWKYLPHLLYVGQSSQRGVHFIHKGLTSNKFNNFGFCRILLGFLFLLFLNGKEAVYLASLFSAVSTCRNRVTLRPKYQDNWWYRYNCVASIGHGVAKDKGRLTQALMASFIVIFYCCREIEWSRARER